MFLDVSHTVFFGFRTGIQRVVRRIVAETIAARPGEVVPVVAIDGRFHALSEEGLQAFLHPAKGTGTGAAITPARGWRRIASDLLLRLAPGQWERRQERQMAARSAPVLRRHSMPEPVRAGPGDVVVLLDAFWGGTSALPAARALTAAGAKLVVTAYDMIPISHPEAMPAAVVRTFAPRFRRALRETDGVIAISRTCAEAVAAFLAPVMRPSAIFYLGDDIAAPPTNARNGTDRPAGFGYAMIGTIEPRKNHAVVLDAFDARWARGDDATLTLVGRIGWAEASLITRIRTHPELGRRLHLLDDADDRALARVIAESDAVIMASLIEGFGLPLIEALAADTPVIASDIPVFREIGGEAVLYFDPTAATDLVRAMAVFERDPEPSRAKARAFEWIDWATSARQFAAAVAAVTAANASSANRVGQRS